MLATLFTGTVAQATARLRAGYDAIANAGEKPIILFGSGPLGQRTAQALALAGRKPIAFADNNKDKWRTEVGGIAVLSPQDAANAYGGTAIFAVTIYNGAAVRRQLRDLGCAHVLHFAALYHGLPEALLPWCDLDTPHEIFTARDEITQTSSLWADDLSRAEFIGQLAWRLGLADPKLPPHDLPQNCYFPPDLVTLGLDAHIVDCGAFDGDSLRLLLARETPFASFLALEPDPENYWHLQQFLQTLQPGLREKITSRQCAVAAQAGTLRFDASGNVTAGINAAGATEVEAVTLDGLLGHRSASLIKMDIEGAELDALAGAKETLRRQKPILAISAYHRQSDLWTIPRLIKSIAPDYDLYLRRHAEDCWELICYALPRAGAKP